MDLSKKKLHTTLSTKQQIVHTPETAGHLMVHAVPIVKANDTVDATLKMISAHASSFESLSYIYVVDTHMHLKGVLSIKELLRTPTHEHIESIMIRNVITVDVHTDQEQVALLAIRHNIKAVPVVDKNGLFLGIVPTDTILNILHSESVEDALHTAGSALFANPAVEIITAGARVHFKKRLPWLLLGLAGGIGAAFVVHYFEDALAHQIILAAFIPAVVYMADAVGSQTQTIFIRSLALARTLHMRSYIIREITIAYMLALVLGLISFGIVALWLDSLHIGIVFGLSITVTILAAMVIALFTPWVLTKMKFDPAIASGPFATVIRDIISLLIYFSIVSLMF
jgi:magnesium transporter